MLISGYIKTDTNSYIINSTFLNTFYHVTFITPTVDTVSFINYYPHTICPSAAALTRQNTGHTQKNSAVSIGITIETEPLFCVRPVQENGGHRNGFKIKRDYFEFHFSEWH
jgi:hypothetical protein